MDFGGWKANLCLHCLQWVEKKTKSAGMSEGETEFCLRLEDRLHDFSIKFVKRSEGQQTSNGNVAT